MFHLLLMTCIYLLRLILCSSEWSAIDLGRIKILYLVNVCVDVLITLSLPFFSASCFLAFYTEICSLETYAGVPSTLGYCCGTLLL